MANDTPSFSEADADEQAKQLFAIAQGELTWAQAIGLTRAEAYGLANSAQRLLDVGQVDKAKKVIEGLIVLNPKDAYFHGVMGALLGQKGDEDGALEHYSKAIELDGTNLAALVNRAELYLKRGDIEPALHDLVKATGVDPKGSTQLGKRALVLARATRDALHAATGEKKPAAPKPAPEPEPKKKKGLFGFGRK
jgi:tetratricopeptide (TPR) repeat protein